MKLLSETHCHTFYSGSGNGHAIGTVRDLVESARKLGFKEIIISDHGPGHVLYGIKRKNLKELRKTIDDLNKEYDDINILMGLESNVVAYSGEIDLSFEEIKIFDRLSVGFHYGIIPKDWDCFFVFCLLNPLAKKIKFLRPYVTRKSTDAMIRVVEKYPINIITHPGSKVRLDIERLAKVCEKTGTALEINSHHNHLSVEEIKIAMKTGVKFSVGADAHRPEHVGNFERALDRIKQAGLSHDRIINLKEED